MKTIGVIPSRYASTRMPGKALADICGKPMVWWVYQAAAQAKRLDEVVVAADHELVRKTCEEYGLNVVMTKDTHVRHLDRIQEVTEKIQADYYTVICGDEPLIQPSEIDKVVPEQDTGEEYVVRSLMRTMDDPVEALDASNIKVVTGEDGECLYLTRSMIPYPYKTIDFKIEKLVGIECFNKKALDFFVEHPMTKLERIEDITMLRYIENHIRIQLIMTDMHQLGVDTPKDLEKVRKILGERA